MTAAMVDDDGARQQIVALFQKHDHKGCGLIGCDVLARVLAELGRDPLAPAEAEALINAAGGVKEVNYINFVDFIFSHEEKETPKVGLEIVHRDMARSLVSTAFVNVTQQYIVEAQYVKELVKRPTASIICTGGAGSMNWDSVAATKRQSRQSVSGAVVRAEIAQLELKLAEEESQNAKEVTGTPSTSRRISISDIKTEAENDKEHSVDDGIFNTRPSMQEELLENALFKESRMSYKEVTEERVARRRSSLDRVPQVIPDKATDETEEALKVSRREAAGEIIQWAITDVMEAFKDELDYVKELTARPTEAAETTLDEISHARKSQRMSQRPSMASTDVKSLRALQEKA